MAQTSVGTSHSRSFERAIKENVTQALGPVIFTAGSLIAWNPDGSVNTEETKFLVRGSLWLPNNRAKAVTHVNADDRLMLVGCEPVAAFLDNAAEKEAIRVISRAYGNVSGAGVADAILCQVTGSKEADALAQTYGFAVTKTVRTGRNNEFERTITNPVAITLLAAAIATGSPLAVAPMAKEQSFSRLDGTNPEILEAISYYKVHGELPERAQTARGANIDDDFASEVNVKEREPRQTGPARGQARPRPAASDDYI